MDKLKQWFRFLLLCMFFFGTDTSLFVIGGAEVGNRSGLYEYSGTRTVILLQRNSPTVHGQNQFRTT